MAILGNFVTKQNGIRELAQAVLDPGSTLSVKAEYGIESLRTAVAAERMGI